jgi:hypothetical protein
MGEAPTLTAKAESNVLPIVARRDRASYAILQRRFHPLRPVSAIFGCVSTSARESSAHWRAYRRNRG